jgi:hypothetical protein
MLAGAGWFALDILESPSDRDWPSIPGAVIGYRANKGCGVRRSMYFVQPIYAYAVDGNAFASNRIANAIGGCANTQAGARVARSELSAEATPYGLFRSKPSGGDETPP